MAIALTLSQHIANTRQFSNTEQNTGFVTDAEITSRLNEAVSELYDLVVVAFEHYYVSQELFTLAGNVGGNTLALPSDFYKDVGLDKDPNTTYQSRVPKLSSFIERNRPGQRQYGCAGNILSVYPPENSQGNYLLYYTPQCPVLAPLTVVPNKAPTLTTIPIVGGFNSVTASTKTFTFDAAIFNAGITDGELVVAGAAHSNNNGTFRVTFSPDAHNVVCEGSFTDETFGGGVTMSYSNAPIDGFYLGVWTMGNAALTQAFVGLSITIAGTASNNGVYVIDTVISATSFTTTAGGVSEIFGPSATMTYQPLGTVPVLDQTLTNWQEFVDIRAAIKVLTKREMDTTSLQADLQALTVRIHAMSANRSEEPSQAALADNVGRNWWNQGGDGWQ